MNTRQVIGLSLLVIILIGGGSAVIYIVEELHKPIPAFPGAEGFGAYTIGGRGGQVIKVTNLNDDGIGSIRYALETITVPRIVVFDVSGIVELSHEIQIVNPYITVAAQTAPADGIILRNAGIAVSTHDVIIRGLKIRVGDSVYGEDPMGRDAISVAPIWGSTNRDVFNVIIDHNEFAWAVDENLSIWNNGDPEFQGSVHGVTYSWNLIYEGLKSELHPEGAESMGLLIGGNNSEISIHHNLIAHNDDRNPRISNIRNIEVINNLIYNWGGTPSRLDNTVTVNIINNYYRPGPSSSTREIKFDDNLNPENSEVFIAGNYVDIDTDPGLDEGEIRFPLDEIHAVILQANIAPITEWYGETPPAYQSAVPVFLLNFLPDPVLDVYPLLMNYAGSQKPDAVNLRILASIENRTGAIIESQDEVGGWPAVSSYELLLDSDNDGMPDDWENAQDFNPLVNDSANDGNANGYSNIEDYINSLLKYPDHETP